MFEGLVLNIVPLVVIGLAVALAHVGKSTQEAGAREFLVRREVPGRWRLELTANPEHADFQIPSLSSTGQALLVASVTSDDYRRLDLGIAALIGMDGLLTVHCSLGRGRDRVTGLPEGGVP
jgi:hypothetical protein